MAKKKTYSNALSFRAAIEDRLRQLSQKDGLEINKLRRQFVFDRLLARFFAPESRVPWALKGGYAMLLRMDRARATKDVDLALKEAKFLTENESERSEALLALLKEQAGRNLGDFLEYAVTGPIKDLENAPYGGSRFLVEARMDGRAFDKFHLDVGIGDVWLEPLDKIPSKGFLDFAGFGTEEYPAICKEQQFAEKLHTYTLPRPDGIENSRVKDLVDMILLIQSETMTEQRLADALRATYERRATHALSKELKAPSTKWAVPYVALSSECGIQLEMSAAFERLQKFVNDLKI